MHKWVVATACPGPYLASKFKYIEQEVNKILGSTTTKTTKTTKKAYTGKFPTKTIKKGSKGLNVEYWQKFLVWAGYDIKVDRDFGPATEKATIKLQTKYKLEPDGVVGPLTITKAKIIKK